MTLYECRGDEAKLNEEKRNNGSACGSTDWLHASCNTIAATWSLGSEVSVTRVSFIYPFPPVSEASRASIISRDVSFASRGVGERRAHWVTR